jgi:hypothetical protein
MRCSICAKRKEAIRELDECKTPQERESKRTDTFDSNQMRFTGKGKRSELNECCDTVVGSVTDTFLGDKQQSHHHTCAKCGKRFPEEGSYEGDWVNDDLRTDNPKFAFK